MPSDANGVYSLPPGYNAITGETIQASQHNPPLEDIATAITGRLMRSGAAPMTGPFKIVDGAVGAPAVQFSNATSTGFFKTDGGIGVSINGTQVAEFGPGGLVTGAHWIGELIQWTSVTAPPLTVFPYGQTLLRTTYADLWTFAQVEIAAGNALYNNGNGMTTFGIPDMRGRVSACIDNTGTVLTSATMTPDGNTLGAKGGSQQYTLSTTEIPSHNHPAVVNDSGHHHSNGFASTNTYSSPGGATSVVQSVNGGNTSSDTTGISVSVNASGGGGAHPIIQPTITTNCLLFVGGPS